MDDGDALGSIGSFGSQPGQNEGGKEEEDMLNLSALQGASAALRDLALEKAAATAHKNIEILTKDQEGRVVVDTVLAMVSKSTEQMTAHEMDEFISALPIDDLFKTFDLDGSGAIDFDEFIQGVRGRLNDRRKRLVNMAFDIMDKDGRIFRLYLLFRRHASCQLWDFCSK